MKQIKTNREQFPFVCLSFSFSFLWRLQEAWFKKKLLVIIVFFVSNLYGCQFTFVLIFKAVSYCYVFFCTAANNAQLRWAGKWKKMNRGKKWSKGKATARAWLWLTEADAKLILLLISKRFIIINNLFVFLFIFFSTVA